MVSSQSLSSECEEDKDLSNESDLSQESQKYMNNQVLTKSSSYDKSDLHIQKLNNTSQLPVYLRKDVVNKSICRAFRKYFYGLFKLQISFKGISKQEVYQTMADHVAEKADEIGLLDFYTEFTNHDTLQGSLYIPNLHF